MEQRRWLQAWLALVLVLFLLSVGWRNLPDEQPQARYTEPLYEYAHDGAPASITGGHVYRGEAVESLVGKYVFGDFIHGKIWALKRTDSGPVVELLLDSLNDPGWEARLSAAAFGVDDAGELYVADRGGTIWRFTEAGDNITLVDAFSPLQFENPIGLVPTGDGRLCIVEQPGRVTCPQEGNASQLLDIRETVNDADWEQGLLGLAFHPGFAGNGRFFVAYTTHDDGTLRLAEFVASANATGVRDHADAGTERVLLEVAQPYRNHNGGHLSFGPDGYLYLGLGDGGKYSDAFANAQNLQSLKGSLLRLDVDAGDPYGIPDGNPFADGGGAPEIWAYGFRNPWKFSFDSETGELWLGDVGQDAWEEINIVERGGNYGWAYYEGSHCYESPFKYYDGWDCSGLDPQAEGAWLWERVLLNPLALLLLGASLLIARRLGRWPLWITAWITAAVISPAELQAALAGAEPPLLVDLRPAKQRKRCRLEDDLHLPFGELQARVAELPLDREIVLYCHLGVNSTTATVWLSRRGYNATSLAGGITAWAREIDPEMTP